MATNFIILAICKTPEIIGGEEYFETVDISKADYPTREAAESAMIEMGSSWEGWNLVIEEEEL